MTPVFKKVNNDSILSMLITEACQFASFPHNGSKTFKLISPFLTSGVVGLFHLGESISSFRECVHFYCVFIQFSVSIECRP